MNAYKANLLNATFLIIFSIWEYYASSKPTEILLTPILFGVIFLSLNNGVHYGIFGQIRAAFILSIICLILLLYILTNIQTDIDTMCRIRYFILIITCTLSVFLLFKSIRKNV